jgi:hypothetical protein
MAKKIKLKNIALLIVLMSTSVFLVPSPNAAAQTGNIVNLQLTFHNYSVQLKDSNGSLCVYDGADGSTTPVNPSQTNVVSEISGTQVVYGMSVSYWSADVIWAIKLPTDLHVDGAVTIKAYISSTSQINGFFSGSGYGMGLVDIDQNNNVMQQFITQAPYTQGGNTFTATPTLYSVSTIVDYTFKAGHYLGFAVGIGATNQGFAGTIYFDSGSYSSGATLPVEDTTSTTSFTVDSNGATHNIQIVSDSAISKYQYNAATNSIEFYPQGINYTSGTCKVSVPKTLMQAPFQVTQGTQTLTATATENSSYSTLSFTNTRSADKISIVGSAQTSTPTGNPTSPTSSSSSTGTSLTATSTPSVPEIAVIVVIPIFVAASLLLVLLWLKNTKTHR